jgi:EF hand
LAAVTAPVSTQTAETASNSKVARGLPCVEQARRWVLAFDQPPKEIVMKFIAALFSLLLFSGVSIAAMPGGKSSAPPFAQIDLNKDGWLSPSEAAAVPGLDFKKADTNHDNKLSRAEYEAAAAKIGAKS